MSSEAITARLVALGVGSDLAAAAASVAGSVDEALLLLGRGPDGTPEDPPLKAWKEGFCEENQRYYYFTPAASQWDAPLALRFQEWSLDSTLYGISVRAARDVYQRCDALAARHSAAVARAALSTLATLLDNVAGCDNSVERFRTVRTSNPKFKSAVWDVAGGPELLRIAGFRNQGGAVVWDPGAALGPLRAAAARGRRLADGKGHTGAAEFLPAGRGGGGAARPPSPLYGTPGFEHQERIYHCSCCDHPINDGSAKVWTGRHDAPRGEYRSFCETCAAASGAAPPPVTKAESAAA
jgi:hypothetical protein